jgi:DNA polymerase-3 subunit gamma/tau
MNSDSDHGSLFNAGLDTGPAGAGYQVLARKYRPTDFHTLIGQPALVQTLTNAIRSGRLAHAYMLAGVRGVGKTTTARIIARALNCIGPDGDGGPTVEPCGTCEHCVAIGEDRHLDVIEMDAASRTGVGDIRDLLDGVPYRPALARYKVYIIDEVHMLSDKAFNALLKTLEEPPAHVRFIFATTEIRKVPVTVLSRCQRFDLRRVDSAALTEHLRRIAGLEGATVSEAALALLARAADGSVRDALSLLDQAIVLDDRAVEEVTVRGMLGLVDRTVSFAILDAVLAGDITLALARLDELYAAGADLTSLFEDLLDLVHWLTRVKVVPDSANRPDLPEAERVQGCAMAERLSMPDVTRAWQMLLKGLAEIRTAPSPIQAAELVLIRLAYVARLPTPAEAIEALRRQPAGRADPSRPIAPSPPQASPPATPGTGAQPASPVTRQPSTAQAGQPIPPRAPTSLRVAADAATIRQPVTDPVSNPALDAIVDTVANAASAPDPADDIAAVASFEQVAALALARKEAILYAHLVADVHLVRFGPGKIELRLADRAPADLPQRLSRFLSEATGERWWVSVSGEAGEPTLRARQDAEAATRLAEATAHPLVQEALRRFPGARVANVRTLARPDSSPADGTLADPDTDADTDPEQSDDNADGD